MHFYATIFGQFLEIEEEMFLLNEANLASTNANLASLAWGSILDQIFEFIAFL